MGTFQSVKTFYASPEWIPGIAQAIERDFTNNGFQVESQSLISGGYDISVTKGGVFKAVLGMKSALKINIEQRTGNIYIEAGVGIFGQQAIPSILSMFFLWPVLITQIWGLVQQSKLDERVMEIAQDYIQSHNTEGQNDTHGDSGATKFCTSCGAPQSSDANFCGKCGMKL